LHSTSEAGRNISERFKHSIRIHGDIAGFIWGIRNNPFPEDYCLPLEESVELIRQEFNKGKL